VIGFCRNTRLFSQFPPARTIDVLAIFDKTTWELRGASFDCRAILPTIRIKCAGVHAKATTWSGTCEE